MTYDAEGRSTDARVRAKRALADLWDDRGRRHRAATLRDAANRIVLADYWTRNRAACVGARPGLDPGTA